MKEKTTKHNSPEIREQAVRMVHAHQGEYSSEWAAIQSISAKFGCMAETLRCWLRQSPIISGQPKASSCNDPKRIKALECENRELRQADEIPRKANTNVSLFLERKSSAI